MRKIICIFTALLLVLAGCTPEPPGPSTPEQTEHFDYGIYELSFTEEALSGDGTDQWEFIYSYNGETIDSVYRITYSLELFTFYYIQVEVVEKGTPSNRYTDRFPVAICDGGSGKTEVAVVGGDGVSTVFKIVCRLTQTYKK